MEVMGFQLSFFQILKDAAAKVLHSICQQIWKSQQWPQDWKRSVFIPFPKKGSAEECSDYCTTTLISHVSKVMLKILQAMLLQYVNQELSDVQGGFRKGRETRDQIANIHWIMETVREFQKNIYFCFIDYTKAFDCVKVSQSCPTLCDPKDYTVHGILQARILECVAILFSRGSSQPRDGTQVSHSAGRFFTSWATGEADLTVWIATNWKILKEGGIPDHLTCLLRNSMRVKKQQLKKKS